MGQAKSYRYTEFIFIRPKKSVFRRLSNILSGKTEACSRAPRGVRKYMNMEYFANSEDGMLPT